METHSLDIADTNKNGSHEPVKKIKESKPSKRNGEQHLNNDP